MILAVRRLKLLGDNGQSEVPVSLFASEESAGVWSCRYQIGWPESTRENLAYGVDAIQAMILALQKVGIELYTSDAHKSGRLVWHNPGEGYGFPVSQNVRDLLVGDDTEL
jgi:hypothetical protein